MSSCAQHPLRLWRDRQLVTDFNVHKPVGSPQDDDTVTEEPTGDTARPSSFRPQRRKHMAVWRPTDSACIQMRQIVEQSEEGGVWLVTELT